jgi:hypothetical protein
MLVSETCILGSGSIARKPQVRFGSRLCENAIEPRKHRIVFSIAFFRQKLPVQLVSPSTKSRRKFYTQVERYSFHTAWVICGSRHWIDRDPIRPRDRTLSDRPSTSEERKIWPWSPSGLGGSRFRVPPQGERPRPSVLVRLQGNLGTLCRYRPLLPILVSVEIRSRACCRLSSMREASQRLTVLSLRSFFSP